LGSLGIFDGSQSQPSPEGDDDWEVAITTLSLHTRTISAMQASQTDQNSLYTASYDSTIRRLDLAKGVAVEVYAPSDATDEEGLSGVQIADSDPNMVYFSTLEGRVGRHDMRIPSAKPSGTKIFSLSERKIGGFSLHPGRPHLLATASLDRTMKLWDLRRIDGEGVAVLPELLGEHESRLSVSHAAFNYAGQVVTTSYDDSIKIHDFGALADVAVGSQISPADMTPKTVVRHNCQTGRWVTMYIIPDSPGVV
jgi:WD40 repeat protein